MRIAVLAIGSEILDGRVVDTNSNFLAGELTALGHTLVAVMQVDDLEQEILDAIRYLSLKAQVIIVSGGLGPTTDDLTREAVASYCGRPLVKDPATLAALLQLYKERKRSFDVSNEKQAYFPEGAEILKNTVGTAAGFYVFVTPALHIFSLPGVPAELRPMFKEELLGRLAKIAGPVTSEMKWLGFKVFGISEAAVGSRIKALNLGPDYTVSYRASFSEIQILIKSKAPDLASVVARAREAVGAQFVFYDSSLGDELSRGADQRLANVVHELMIENGKTIAVAESCSGGLLGAALSSQAGSSRYFLGGIISYSNQAKTNFLDVSSETIRNLGAVSAQTAEQMACGAQQRFDADLAISITGIAGPDGGTAAKPVGTFFMGFCSQEGSKESPSIKTVALPYFFSSRREAIRQYAVNTALDNLRRYLLKIPFRAADIF